MSLTREPLRQHLRAPLSAGDADRMWRAIAERRSARPRRRAVLGFAIALGAAAAVASAVLVVGRLAPRADAKRAMQAPKSASSVPASQPGVLRWANGAPLSSIEVADGAPARMLELSDGTRVSLASGSRLVARAATAERTELALDRGRARFEVRPQDGRQFEVVSAGVRVEVVGTIFTVERAAAGERVRVAVEHGRVRVRAEGLPQTGALLGAGEQLDWQAPVGPDESALQSAGDAAAREQSAQDPRSGARRGAANGAALPDDPRALLAIADEARAAGQPARAAVALARLVARHPRSEHAPLAALTLGRLQLDALHDPAAAARSLRHALALGLPRALHEDALARLVQAHAAAGDVVAASAAAGEYRERFPRGRWRASVDTWSVAAER